MTWHVFNRSFLKFFNKNILYYNQVLQSIDDGLRDILMLSRVLSESLLQPESLANIETLSSDLGNFKTLNLKFGTADCLIFSVESRPNNEVSVT